MSLFEITDAVRFQSIDGKYSSAAAWPAASSFDQIDRKTMARTMSAAAGGAFTAEGAARAVNPLAHCGVCGVGALNDFVARGRCWK
jgi:hypothetical protein